MKETNNQTVTTCNEGNSNATSTECGKEENITCFVKEQDMLLELKVLMSDYYVATFTREEKYLQIAFLNGQKFKIYIEECK